MFGRSSTFIDTQRQHKTFIMSSLLTSRQKKYLVGPYYAGPKWRYFSRYGVKRAGITCLSMRV